MRKVIAVEYLSLDGIMSDPMWTAPYFNEELGRLQDTWLAGSESLLLERCRRWRRSSLRDRKW